MPKITVLPHAVLCPTGAVIEYTNCDMSLCETLLAHGIEIEHACEMACACTTCHVIIRHGFDTLLSAEEMEEDLLDRAWGLEATSRLSCQLRLPQQHDLVVEIPRYTVNHARENH